MSEAEHPPLLPWHAAGTDHVHNFLGIEPWRMCVSKAPLKSGKYTLGMEFSREFAGRYGESLGKTRLYANDEAVAEGPKRNRADRFTLSGDGLRKGGTIFGVMQPEKSRTLR